MTDSLFEKSATDDRWVHGMNGWRVRLHPTFAVSGLECEHIGEVTGFQSPDRLWVVFDGEDEPRGVYWHAVRPA